MARDRSLVRASDLSAWAYCNRAWWLAHVQNAAHAEPDQLARGTAAHRRHGVAVWRARQAQRAGLALLLLALLAAVAVLIQSMM